MRRPKPEDMHEDRLLGEHVVYFVLAESVGKVKVGKSRVADDRLTALRNGSPVPLHIYGEIGGYSEVERWCHRHLAAERSHLEWFNWSTRTHAFIDLVLSHGPTAAKVLCPGEWKNDHLRATGKRVRGFGETALPIGESCYCTNCQLYARLQAAA